MRIKQIPKLCVKNGMPAVAITDTHNLFGALEFAMGCADSGVQPIIGCQVNVIAHWLPDNHKMKDHPDKVLLLCQNEEGYLNLMQLVSDSYFQMDLPHPPQVTFKALKEHARGLICLNGGKHSSLYRLLAFKRFDDAHAEAAAYKECFGDRFYLEIQRHHASEGFDPDEHAVENGLLKLADAFPIPLVATNDVFFKDREMHQAHDALLCIADGRYVSETERRKVTPEHYFKSPQEMREIFSDLPEAIYNTSVIARRCHYMPTSRKPILPCYKCAWGRTEVEELRLQAQEGICARLKHLPEVPKHYQERLEYEISVIENMGFSGYFLIVADFIKFAKRRGIPVGPGRGSGAGSLVAWSLTITDMDPIRFGLIFERFLNPERISMPDFDVDFCQDRRDEVIEYVREKYGNDRVAHIITFGKLQARAVLRDVGRVLQMPYSQVDRISKLVPNNPANPVTLKQALVLEPALEEAQQNDETVRELIGIGTQLEGLYRHVSKHAAGVVIGDRPLSQIVPLYVDEPGSIPATQFNMKYVELAGLVKFDFLGLKTLTVIEKCCDFIRKKGNPIRPEDIPLDDIKTFELLQRVETVGIFQLESSGMREVVRKLKPDRFEDLIALVALFRPGPMDDIPRYVACKHGEEPVTYLHPALEPILKDTYGVMVYQEQVMHIAQKLGGYSLGAADLLRRAMGKKIKAEMDDQRAIFTNGAIIKGLKPDIASQIFDQMAKFAGYGFNKSHSAPYALLAYQTAYLKANYPREFYAASMTYDMHNTDKLNAFRQDMVRLGVQLLPPNINHSYSEFCVERLNDGKEGVRYGLAAIKNVGHAVIDALTSERDAHGHYKSIQDFAERLNSQNMNKRQLENLIAAGCFDVLEKNRALLYNNAEVLLRYAAVRESNVKDAQQSLFGSVTTQRSLHLEPVQQWGPLEKLSHEFNALSFFLSSHPLEIYTNLQKLGSIPSSHLAGLSDDTTVKLVGVVITKAERTSKTGNKYAFVQLSDQHGVYEIALFSDNYVKAREFLIPGKALFVTAHLRQDDDSTRLMAKSVVPLEKVMQGLTHTLRIIVDETLSSRHIETILSSAGKGQTAVVIQVRLVDAPYIDIFLPGHYNMSPEIRSRLLATHGVIKIEDV